MSDNVAIYSTLSEPISDETIAGLVPGPKLTARDESDGRRTIDLVWPKLTITVNRWTADSPDFAEHIRGFLGYVLHLAEGHMDARLWEIYYTVSKARQSLGIVIEPGWDDDVAERFVSELAVAACGIVFNDNQLTDPWGEVLLGPGNERGPGVLYSFESAKQRREKSNGRLAALGLATPDVLPPTVANEEGLTQTADDAARRAIVLMAVAMRAEGVAQPKVVKFLAQRGVTKAVSQREKTFLQDARPDPEVMSQLTWRYEALWTLLWSLGLIDQLGSPGQQCDARRAVKIVNETPVQKFIDEADFRLGDEILDELDFYYRAHWHVVRARQEDRPIPAGLDADVIYERHYALNWLTRYMYQEWDDVTTDT